MNTVIAFPVTRRDRPAHRRAAAEAASQQDARGPAQIIILPVVRIERHDDHGPAGKPPREVTAGGRKA